MSMMMNLAEHILAVGQEEDVLVTNLALQKVMYFVIKAGVRNRIMGLERAKTIYDEPFLAWKYGPVVQSVYDRFSCYGSNGIEGNFTRNTRFDDLNDIIRKLIRIDVFSLVSRSHQEMFWLNNQPESGYFRSQKKYGIEDIIGE